MHKCRRGWDEEAGAVACSWLTGRADEPAAVAAAADRGSLFLGWTAVIMLERGQLQPAKTDGEDPECATSGQRFRNKRRKNEGNQRTEKIRKLS